MGCQEIFVGALFGKPNLYTSGCDQNTLANTARLPGMHGYSYCEMWIYHIIGYGFVIGNRYLLIL